MRLARQHPAGDARVAEQDTPAEVVGGQAEFESLKDSRGEFRFRLKVGNGEVVATGESYST